MRLPIIRGMIDRRVLVNYRVDPEVLSSILPAPFRPQLVEGYGIAGICLIRLRQLRPAMLPSFTGFGSENAAHRIAVEWDSDEGIRTGVFVPRRDTSSMFTSLAGGRIFPGMHHRAAFNVQETGESLKIQMRSLDGAAHVCINALATTELSEDSVFESTESVSRFFEDGSRGYSPDRSGRNFEGLELRTMNWQVQPLSVSRVESSFFSDKSAFPEGSVTFDNALLMRGIDHEWHSCEAIASSPQREPATICL